MPFPLLDAVLHILEAYTAWVLPSLADDRQERHTTLGLSDPAEPEHARDPRQADAPHVDSTHLR